MLKKLVKNGFYLANGVLVFLTFLAYLSRFVSAQDFWVVSIMGLLLPWFFFAHLCFIALWVWRKKKIFLLSLFTLIIGWSHLQSIINLSAPSKPTDVSLTVMSYNTARLGLFRKHKFENTFAENVYQNLKDYPSPDVICLQETGYNELKQLKLKLKLPYEYVGDRRGLAIISRYPISDGGIIDLKSSGNGAIWATLKTNQGPLKIYSVHLESNRITRQADDLAENMDLENRKTYSTIKYMLRMYKNAAIRREKQSKKLLASIQKDAMPVLVCGDFNETPQSMVYGYFSKALQDGFVQKGKGLGTTFNGSIPLLKIDHIFGSNQIAFENYYTPGWKFSDHFPVLAVFHLSEP